MAWYAGSTMALVLASTSILYVGLTRELDQATDSQLRERIELLRALLRSGKAREAELEWEVESAWEFVEHQMYLRILDQRRNPVLQTREIAGLLPANLFPVAPNPEGTGRGFQLSSPSGRVFRAMSATATEPRTGQRWEIQAALDLGAEDTVLRDYRFLVAIVTLAAALIGLALGYRITRGGLRPLAEIVETTQGIRGSALSSRIRLEGLPTELTGLAGNFNTMLDRLEDSFNRLSRFSADIAHELRTPINNLRGEAEVALSRARSAEEYREALTSSLEEYAHLSAIIESLLFIAQAETQATAIRRGPVNALAELKAVAAFYEPVAAERRLHLHLDCHHEFVVFADRALLRRAVSNLVSNAVAHTPDGGSISISATSQQTVICVAVSDTGVGIAPEHLPHLFDRFYRIDPARPRTGHVGLGLSIVRTIMDLHGGTVEIASEPGRGTRVTLAFPRPSHAPGSHTPEPHAAPVE